MTNKPLFKKINKNTTYNNSTFYLKYNKKMIISIISCVVTTIILFFLTTIITTGDFTTSVGLKLQVNWKRTMVIFITGFDLGICSFLLQRMTKNRLTDTAVMGFGNVNLIPLIILAVSTNFSNKPNSTGLSTSMFYQIIPIVFILFSVATTIMFQLFSTQGKQNNYSKILICGIMLNFIAIAISLTIKRKLDYLAWPVVQNYILGFVDSIPKENGLYFSLAVSMVAFIWLSIISSKLKICIMNQQLAIQLGISNHKIFMQAFICIGLLVGSSYAISGDFVFVGLLAGNFAFMIFKNRISYGIFGSGCIGSIITLLTFFIFGNLINLNPDIIPQLIPLLISPYFIFLLFRKNY